MSEGPREFDFNFDAANEVEEQVARAKAILTRLAAHLAATEPGRDPYFDWVEKEHVRQAAAFLFGSADVETAADATSGKCVFISFSFKDEPFVSELSEKLHSTAITHFKANVDIRAAAEWADVIWEAMRSCQVFLPILTSCFLESDWRKFEVGAACASRKTVLPVLRNIEQAQVPEPLNRFQSIVVENTSQLSDLVEQLERLCAE